ncbi:MAG: tRNA (guanosine(37)-N1)-methyltransferase TrmD [Clostridia bacterium]|nr:tRNA (guanosine(37)-N1)-methyltransferase TrmD [Clostridia bacterium]
MRIDILTLFPNMFTPLKESILGRAQDAGLIDINVIDIREFSLDKHKKCDDYTFGGGEGLLMTPQPLFDCIESVLTPDSYVIYLSPRGTSLTQVVAQRLVQHQHIILICGHYEGIDQRVIDTFVDEEVSIGDYVLTGGELPAMVLVDCMARLIPNVLGNDESAKNESFSNGYLEFPQYTRPQEFRGLKVPEVLLSGHHQKIQEWREAESQKITQSRRPDLLKTKE